MDKWSKLRAALTKRKTELETRLHNIEDVLETPPEKDFEDYATEQEGTEVLESMGTAGQHEIAMINAALARMKAGTYGTCQRCGEAIDMERLSILPETPFCKTCARAAA
ncbi:MAG: TraR/DksA C4-type zinc finger protein [Pseudomonadota bacterium]